MHLLLHYSLEEETIGEPVPAEVVRPLKSAIARDGEPVRFECTIVGNPRPNIVWFHDVKVIRPSPDFLQFYNADNVCSLAIREAYPEDTGRYTVVAKNTLAVATCSAELTVKENELLKGSSGPLLYSWLCLDINQWSAKLPAKNAFPIRNFFLQMLC